jgi:hypothetical protein
LASVMSVLVGFAENVAHVVVVGVAAAALMG